MGSGRWVYVSTAICGRKASSREWGIGNGESSEARFMEPDPRAGSELLAIPDPPWPIPGLFQAIALSMICASWVLLTAPICVACTLPSRKIIRVGMPRTL